MADQATLRSVNGKGSDGLRADRAGLIAENLRPERSMAGETDPADQGVVSNVAGFGENLLTLAELQTRLTSVEIRQNLESIKSGDHPGLDGGRCRAADVGLRNETSLCTPERRRLILRRRRGLHGGCTKLARAQSDRLSAGERRVRTQLELAPDHPPPQRPLAAARLTHPRRAKGPQQPRSSSKLPRARPRVVLIDLE
jgi:hypothetical protein